MNSFAHLEHVKCLTKPETLFDIGIIGVPFDTAVSYRPGLFTSILYVSIAHDIFRLLSISFSEARLTYTQEHDSVLEPSVPPPPAKHPSVASIPVQA